MSIPPKNDRTSQSDTDRTELGKLYPQPKSYDELRRTRKERSVEYKNRKPHHIIFSTSIRLYTILVATVLTVAAIPFLIQFNVISGVSFSFLIVTILLAYSFWIGTHISASLYQLGFSARPFFFLYIAAFIILFSCSQFLLTDPNLLIQLGVGTILHYVIVYILLKLMLRSSDTY